MRSVVGVLSILLAFPTTGNEPDAGIQEEIQTVVRADNRFCFTRPQVDVINAIIKSEKRCRLGRTKCREEKIRVIDTGWDPVTVVMIVGVITIVMFGSGVALGALVK